LFCLLQQQARPLPLLVGSEETAETPMEEVALFTTYPSTFLAVERRTTLPTNVDTLTFFRLPTAFASKAGRKRHLPDGENASALDAADGLFGGFLACPGLRLRHPHDTAALRYQAVTVRGQSVQWASLDHSFRCLAKDKKATTGAKYRTVKSLVELMLRSLFPTSVVPAVKHSHRVRVMTDQGNRRLI
jgi:hypothetical protein